MLRSTVRVAGLALSALALACPAFVGCTTPTAGEARPFTEPPPKAPGQEIVVAGKRIAIGAPVVLWSDLESLDGYRNGLVERGFGDRRGANLAELREKIDLFVLHYDTTASSRVCLKVLKERGLSVHFLLDLDGTLYQTLDVSETAWHATVANGRSIGIEMANIGAYPPGGKLLDEWYPKDAGGPWVRLPEGYDPKGTRTEGFIGRPARPQRFEGVVNGNRLQQHDFTKEQYRTLTKLTAALCRAFPDIRPDAPRGADGTVRNDALSEDELAGFDGIVGHCHVQANKADPGPAFDWERFLGDVGSELGTERARP